MALPTSRHLLTSLINTLTSYQPQSPNEPIYQPITTPSHQDNTSEFTNPFKALPNSHRALLTTLHVIIPPPTLLQALDLLDRQLVTRISYSPSPAPQNQDPNLEQSQTQDASEKEKEKGKVLPPLQAHIHLHKDDTRNEDVTVSRKAKQQGFYLVKSSQIPKGRFRTRDEREISGTQYIVRLEAWNCSCAAFAFAAFPSTTSGNLRSRDDEVESEKEQEWEYGGESLDGRDEGGEGVPVCKHLLACLLGERWGSVLGGFVCERVVGKEEMAGLSAC